MSQIMTVAITLTFFKALKHAHFSEAIVIYLQNLGLQDQFYICMYTEVHSLATRLHSRLLGSFME